MDFYGRQLASVVILATTLGLQSANPAYERGRQALDRGDWLGAIDAFETVDSDPSWSDAALYWRAYAFTKLGDADRALELTASLEERFPDSEWRDDARALAAEIRPSSGNAVAEDEELKLMALNSLMRSGDVDAIAVLEDFLRGDHSPRLKARALFVLAQSGSDRGFDVLAEAARNDGDPELQQKALTYLGANASARSLGLLAELYTTVENVEARRAILRGFMMAGDKERLLRLAREETDEDLRRRALRLLGTMDAGDELWELYQNESSEEVRKALLRAFMVGGDVTRLLGVAQDPKESTALRAAAIRLLGTQSAGELLWRLYQREESEELKGDVLRALFIAGNHERLAEVARDPGASLELRKSAVHNLGLVGKVSRGELMAIYQSESPHELKAQTLHSFFIQEASRELIEIARDEKDSELKKQAVHWLSLMEAPEARQFMLEVLRR